MILNRRLEQAAKKINLTLDDALKIVGYNHELNNGFFKAKELTKTDLQLDSKTAAFLNKVSKALKVDVDAVIVHFLVKFLGEKKQ